ncbi:DUF4253 domain-containing protein [Actinoplanes sp. NEAU-A12]|uniref:DUF4253 domain-containing protein n=1 Tax=Actinoplanes sandaracinus TaxID=3045177 RepID=A0ABT6X120_9ACTN|nr:DUF4253 domain-containing protein [Actinoplanes sandaracinus]MDI6105703.1 DUF4253 domain-containing protein [Actinoplanes sandaracinus]
MQQILRAAGLESHSAKQYSVHDETVIVVDVAGDAQQMWRSARAGLTDHYPVLALPSFLVTDSDFHHAITPGQLIAQAATFDVEAYLTRQPGSPMPGARNRDPEILGTGDEGYDLAGYDVASFGEPEVLVIVPRPEPWAAFAYLDAYASLMGVESELMTGAAHQWWERYGAVPTVIGLACGFTVSRPPTELADAERLAAEHVAIAGLTAGTSIRAYARALMQLDHWTLYNRP